MAMLDHALALAARGFHVFPCEVGGKLPIIKDFPNRATRDEAQIRQWWDGRDFNVGISTTHFGDDAALIVVDVDKKKGKNGDRTLLQLELQGLDLPPTLQSHTPTGGRHLIYVAEHAAKQGVEVLGEGLDIRSRGGYIVGPGSVIDGAPYAEDLAPVGPAPAWLIERLGRANEAPPRAAETLEGVDADRAEKRAATWLFSEAAPIAVQGSGGDTTAYKVACKLKDFGCTQDQAGLLMAQWNELCDPPWNPDELDEKIAHAYRYGKEPVGSAAPEAIFDAVDADVTDGSKPHPADVLNDEYAFIKKGAFVLQETTDSDGTFTTLRLSPPDMHAWFDNKRLQVGEKAIPLSKLWFARPSRREYDSVAFSPAQDPGSRFYNLWRGFMCEPKAGGHPALDAFLEHALKNVCGGDAALCAWLLGFFAHMIQRPWEKPLTAIVFRGSKGTGKNALVERVGWLLGAHFMVADDDRYLLGNFNSHLESNLFFVLDEASWAGDKRAEGKLKGLITGSKHNIERKGFEQYPVKNLTRVAIIGNERWLVPATFEERRFAVFDVGDGRRQDRAFFEGMRVGMEQGGYRHLLHYLQQFDLSRVDVNAAPRTQGLIDQVHASLEPVHEWWLDCLKEDRLHGSTFTGAMPERIPTDRAREAFVAWARGRQIKSRLPGHKEFLDTLRGATPALEKKRLRVEGELSYVLVNPGIAALRADWERFVGGSVRWED